MEATASKIGELRDSNQSRGSDLERVADHVPVSKLDQPAAHYPNGQVGSGPERLLPSFLVISGLMAIEVGILAVHCQGSSPFDTHPVNSWTFVFAMFIHFGAALYNSKCFLQGSRCSNICDLVGYISGSLASAAFLSILVPPSLVSLVYIILMLHLPMYVDFARNWILKVAKRLYGYLSNGAVHVQNIWNRIIGSNNNGPINLPN